MKKWEYKVVDYPLSSSYPQDNDDVERVCNEHGEQGWELVSYQHGTPAYIKPLGDTLAIRFIFKRQLGGGDGIYLA